MTEISSNRIAFIAEYVKRHTGIFLDDSKKYLIESRFRPLMRELGTESWIEFQQKLGSDSMGLLKKKVIDAITTNETYFFRDKTPFDLLRHKLIPEIILSQKSALRPSLKIWSAACSTGQEIYSIAIVLRETIPDIERWNVRIIGTDIGDAAIRKASYGKYSRLEADRGLDPRRLTRYFTKEGDLYKVKDELRYLASFSQGNLLESFTHLGMFDIIFARNVAIYFTQKDKIDLFHRIAERLNPNGTLIVGASESITLFTQRFQMNQYMNGTYYQVKK